MFSLISTILGWVLKLIFPGKQAAKIEDIAASNATAQAELTQETARAQIIHTADTAAAAADARSLRDQPGASSDTVITGPGKPDIVDPDITYRD